MGVETGTLILKTGEKSEAVKNLDRLLKEHEGWEDDLLASLAEAKRLAVAADVPGAEKFPVTRKDYNAYLNGFVAWIPGTHLQPRNVAEDFDFDRDAYYELCKFYWLLDQPTGRKLQEHEDFKDWMVGVAREWGEFCDTPKSITEESLFYLASDPRYNIKQYMRKLDHKPTGWSLPDPAVNPTAWWVPSNPSGWCTFNQFFAREVNPGLRPVAGCFDDSIVVSPADSTFVERFPIDEHSEIVVKHTHTYNVMELLEGSAYRDAFKDGLFMHSFLNPYDYHRFHAPVRGTVLESREILGEVYLDVQIQGDQLYATDGTGYQFTQQRGLIVFDSPIGLVAVLPIGMAQVSSVNMIAVEGAYMNKGEEFGYFTFGGSDIILLFQAESDVVLTAAPDIHYNTGMCIGEVPRCR